MHRIIETDSQHVNIIADIRRHVASVYYLWFWFSILWCAFRDILKDERARNEGARTRGRENRHTQIIILLNDPLIIVSKQIDAPVRCTRCYSFFSFFQTLLPSRFLLVTNVPRYFNKCTVNRYCQPLYLDYQN